MGLAVGSLVVGSIVVGDAEGVSVGENVTGSHMVAMAKHSWPVRQGKPEGQGMALGLVLQSFLAWSQLVPQ